MNFFEAPTKFPGRWALIAMADSLRDSLAALLVALWFGETNRPYETLQMPLRVMTVCGSGGGTSASGVRPAPQDDGHRRRRQDLGRVEQDRPQLAQLAVDPGRRGTGHEREAAHRREHRPRRSRSDQQADDDARQQREELAHREREPNPIRARP